MNTYHKSATIGSSLFETVKQNKLQRQFDHYNNLLVKGWTTPSLDENHKSLSHYGYLHAKFSLIKMMIFVYSQIGDNYKMEGQMIGAGSGQQGNIGLAVIIDFAIQRTYHELGVLSEL